MPIVADFATGLGEAGSITLSMTPPTSVSGWSVRYFESKHFGSQSGLIQRFVSSGFVNVSGINVTNGAQGVFTVSLPASDTSGRDFGAYAYKIERTDSGYQSILSTGFRLINP